MGLAAAFIGGAVLAVEVGLRSSTQNKFIQAATFLAQEELDSASALAGSDWHKIDADGLDALSPTPAQNYINTAAPPFFVVRDAAETKDIDGVTYTRYFMVDPVSRDVSGNIEAVYNPVNADPATEKITAFVSWPNAAPLSITRYIARLNNTVSVQTDWSGGAQVDQMFGADPTKFSATDGAIDYYSQSGSIKLILP